ncbi:MAG TPA: hypothetical protein VFZ78_08155 [Flavisolibacter sp.]
MNDVPLSFDYNGKHITGVAVPLNEEKEIPTAFDLIIDKAFLGTLRCNPKGWMIDTEQDPQLIQVIGRYIHAWYE